MTTTNGSTPSVTHAALACSRCRKQKRKCTKELPKCSLCERLQKSCDYDDVRQPSTQEDVLELQGRVHDLETLLKDPSQNDKRNEASLAMMAKLNDFLPVDDAHAAIKEFPAMFFLDSEVCRMTRIRIPEPRMTIPKEVASVLGDLSQTIEMVSTFFTTIHLWLPFVSKKRMGLALSRPNYEPKPDEVALLLTMKLITDSSCYDLPQSQHYFLVKSYVSLLEAHGSVSIPYIQAVTLMALYEIGHAIYPAAYLSPARAARLGAAYGIDNRRGAPQMGLDKLGSWAENQEIKRTWWAIMILDRFVNLNIEGHSLATGEPHENDVLPADCNRWDNGEQSISEPLYLFSPINIQASPFARTCQAAHLMGKFIKQRNDDRTNSIHRHEDALQIHRTIAAFVKLLPGEVVANPISCGSSLALTYSTLLHLYDPYSCAESNTGSHTPASIEMQTAAIAGLPRIAGECLEFSQLLSSDIHSNLQASSPFVIECLYHVATQYAWLAHENGPGEMVAAYNHLKDQLSLLSGRWRLAAEYLKILDHTKGVLYNGNDLL